MLIATELPIHYQAVLASLTDYDFCIGSEYVKLPGYAEFYKAQRKSGRFVILDNGAFEGELLSTKDLLRILMELHPQEVVAPDVIGDRGETYERAKEFTHKVREDGLVVSIQVCPQGRSFEEWTESYNELADLPGVSSIGISYVGHFDLPEDCDYFGPMASEETIRLRFFHYLAGVKQLRSDKAHHLLGLYSPAALRWYARYPFIRSIDTSFPIICATLRQGMSANSVKAPVKLDYGISLESDQLALAIQNILWMRGACR